jgi:hypothetical protein
MQQVWQQVRQLEFQRQVPPLVDLWLVTISLSQQEGENLENIKRYD